MATEDGATAERILKAQQRYASAMHGVQSGVAMEIGLGRSSDTTPKHLRVGINAAMVDHGALTAVLLAKGVLTELEYFESLAEFAERERAAYERKLGQSLGAETTITLG